MARGPLYLSQLCTIFDSLPVRPIEFEMLKAIGGPGQNVHFELCERAPLREQKLFTECQN